MALNKKYTVNTRVNHKLHNLMRLSGIDRHLDTKIKTNNLKG